MATYWFYVIAAGLLGLGAGFYWGRNSQPDVKIRAELEARAQAADQKHTELSMQVQEHFSETARLVNQLSQQYREVHEHLAKAQDQLAGTESLDPSEKIQALTAQATPEPETLIEQDVAPRDYADTNGTLAEAQQRTSAS